MAKLAPPQKATKPTAPKKPTSRSKTGNAACSSAASNWQLALRGKAALDPETYRTLAKCRAMNRTAKMAEAQGRTGKLSAMGESAVKARLQARFDSGLITAKSRTERLDMLLKQRAERGKAETAVVPKPATTEAIAPKQVPKLQEKVPQYAIDAGIKTWKQADKLGARKVIEEAPGIAKMAVDPTRNKFAIGSRDWLEKEIATRIVQRTKIGGDRVGAIRSVAYQYEDEAKRALEPGWSQVRKSVAEELHRYKPAPPPAPEPIPPKPAERYSLGGKLAPGRKANALSYTLNVGNSIDRSGKLVPGYAARITGTDPKYKLKREFLPLKEAKDGGLTVTNRGLYESRGPSTSIFGTDRANKPTEREYILIGRKKVRNLVDFQAERAVRLMERFRKS